MKALEYIFYLGIISAVFRFLWGFFIILLVMLKGSTRKGIFEAYLLKMIKYFLLVSLISKFSNSFSQGEPFSVELTYTILGGVIIFMYMVGKNEKKQTLLTIQKQFGQMFSNISNSYNAKLEWLIIALSMAYFITSIFIPQILSNPITLWFEDAIKGIYTTPVIGWIFKFIGLIFLVQILFKGFNAIRILITGRKYPNMQNDASFMFSQFQQENKKEKEEGFDDYEDVTDENSGDDQEEEEKK